VNQVQRIRTAWNGYQTSTRARRAARADRRQLAQDLSVYTSASDRADMDAVFARYERSDIHEVWSSVSQRASLNSASFTASV
jgi:hypothetical protein